MFKKARIKLTIWYLLVIIFVNIFFSLIIYRQFVKEINRFSIRERFKIVEPFREKRFPPQFFNKELGDQLKKRVIINLLILNGGILLLTVLLGYFLAGKTLKPIEEMIEEQNRFISDASHELRTPLTSLKIGLELGLKNKDVNKETKDLLKESLDEVNHLQRLTDSLLTLSQYKNTNYSEEVFLQEVISKAISRVKNLAYKKKIKIKNQVSNDYLLVGNKESLVDLLTIVLDNAIKYSSNNKTVLIYLEEKNRLINLYIKDQGIGIDKKDLPFIFNRFYRADKARLKEKKDGFGLGLSIAKKIIEDHQGKISVESKINKGTTVILSFSKFRKN